MRRKFGLAALKSLFPVPIAIVPVVIACDDVVNLISVRRRCCYRLLEMFDNDNHCRIYYRQQHCTTNFVTDEYFVLGGIILQGCALLF